MHFRDIFNIRPDLAVADGAHGLFGPFVYQLVHIVAVVAVSVWADRK